MKHYIEYYLKQFFIACEGMDGSDILFIWAIVIIACVIANRMDNKRKREREYENKG